MRRALALAVVVSLAAGCAVREPRPEGEWLAERAAWFAQRGEWSVRGRLGLSDGERGGTLALRWRAVGASHEIVLRTVAGGRQWRLELDPGGARLTGTGIEPLVGPDPDPLVERAIGWPIPVRWMSEWLRGLPGPARADYADDGTLAGLAWRDWTLDYERWRALDDAGILLPARVEARNPPYRVRAVLSDWAFD
jgi:outer membrane lipoprotein LolB